MVAALNTSVSLGSSITFDLPWSDANVVILILEPPGGTGTYGIGWSAVEAPVPQDAFLLPYSVIVLVAGAAIALVATLVSRRRSRLGGIPPRT